MSIATEVAGRWARWLPVYVLAAWLGRQTVLDESAISLVWPAAGIGALWLATATRRSLPYDAAGLGLAVFAVNHATGAPLGLSLVFLVGNVLQALAFVAVMRRWVPHLRHFGGRASLGTLRDLSVVIAASAASAVVGAAVGGVGLLVLGLPSAPLVVAVWWGRNFAGLLVLAVLGLLLLHRRDARRGLADPLVLLRVGSRAEVAALWLVSAAVLVVVFGSTDVLPLSFVLLFSTVVLAIRSSPVVVAVHSLLVGVGALGFTLADRGPFASIPDLTQRALVVQVFVVMTVLTGLVLVFSRLERDRATVELRALQRDTADRALLFGSVLEHLREGLNVIDADGQVLVSNSAGDRLLGRDVEDRLDPETLGRTYGVRRLDGSPIAAHEVHYVRAAAGEVFQEDVLLTRPDAAAPIVLEVSGGPLPTEPGETPQAVITFRDVTALRHDRDALATFAGVVAHDLKRPLTVINGWTDALAEDVAADALERESALQMLARVSGAGAEMGRLIDDLLHYTVVRDAPVRLEDLDVSALAEESARPFRERDVAPRVTVVPGLRASADPVLLRQVLDNLIGNAVKYVAPGVRPRVVVDGRTEGDWVVLGVEDNGIGIPEADRQRVFESFQRAHAQDYRGTGLGLAIVRRAVERCGGTVAVGDSEAGGSRFEVWLRPARTVAGEHTGDAGESGVRLVATIAAPTGYEEVAAVTPTVEPSP